MIMRSSTLFSSCRPAVIFLLLLTSCGSAPKPQPREMSKPDWLATSSEQLRARLEIAGIPANLMVGEELINAAVALPQFYERRGYQLAWIDTIGPNRFADELVMMLHKADEHGLRSQDYHLERIERTIAVIRENREAGFDPVPGRLVDLELLLSDAYLVYGSHLLSGRVNPETFDAEWLANRREADMATVLENAFASQQIAESLQALEPAYPAYRLTKKALANYREIQRNGGWPMVPEGPKMQQGESGERVQLLRERLRISGDLDSTAAANGIDIYDEALETAVRNFQRRHGLFPDGVAGAGTVTAMNVPVEERIKQLVINLERSRWLPQSLGNRYLLVNIADYELSVFEADTVVLRMRVIVGRNYRRTPVFSDRMTYLVLAPYWHVTPTMAVQDKLPQIKKDIGYLDKQKIRVFRGWGADAQEIDPSTIDWKSLSARNFPYRLRQDPGPVNALGKVKFMFPNRFNVYLHDTPSRELFTRTVRNFSSGCIRIEKPLELTEYLLRDNPGWTRQRIDETIKRNVEQTVTLRTPIPVHLQYWTAWAFEDGVVNFRSDIYSRDERVAVALLAAPPAGT